MRLSALCTLNLSYVDVFHLLRPYGNEAGTGWGRGTGTVVGDRLSGSVQWSNHPTRRGDGNMLPNVRGVIRTTDDAEVLIEMSGRTIFDNPASGHQLLFTLFESESSNYRWLNDVVCISEGRIDLATIESRIDVHLCEGEGTDG